MPMLDCPELAELDLEPAAAPFLQMHDPGSIAKQQRYNARKQQTVAGAAPGAPQSPALVKLEADQHPFHHHHHQHQQRQRDDHHHLGVRASTRFKHVLGESCEAAWMSLMDPPPASIHLQQQQEHQLEDKKPLTSPAPAAPAASAAAAPQAEDKNKAEQRRYPAPYCSCTGVNQQCYRWGNGGWQSACCTTKISVYPLPMNPKKKGSRVAGRKMSAGAFRKLLDRLAAEGVDVNNAVDLRPHWAKHGTNRYVTIK